MENNPENLAWAIEQLAMFTNYPNFPTNSKMLDLHAKSLLRIVHKKTIAEIIQAKRPDFSGSDMADWEQRNGIPCTTLDTDWLFEVLAEQCRFYPVPDEIRQRYTRLLPSADGREG